MGYFTFRCRRNGKEKVFEGTIAEAEEFRDNNPGWDWLPGKPMIISGVSIKPPQGFRDILKDIKKKAGKTAVMDTY